VASLVACRVLIPRPVPQFAAWNEAIAVACAPASHEEGGTDARPTTQFRDGGSHETAGKKSIDLVDGGSAKP